MKNLSVSKKIALILIVILLIAITILSVITINKRKNLKTENSADYVIKYNYNFDNLTKKVTVGENKFAKSLLVERSNYSFMGWYLNGILFDFSKPIKSDVSLTALWREKQEGEYTIIFDSDGGTTVENQIVISGKPIEEPVVPIRDNYIFMGWHLKGILYDFTSVPSNDLTLSAKWQEVNKNTNANTNNSNEDTNTSTTNKDTNANTNNSNEDTNTSTTNNDDKNSVETILLPKVTNVFVEYSSLGDVVISFDNLTEDISGYEIYRSLSTNDNYEKIATIKNNSTRNVYDSSKDYKYKVRAYKSTTSGLVYGTYSDITNVPKRPLNPTGVFFDIKYSSNSYNVDLRFDKTGADKYIIYSGSNGKDDYGVFETINGGNSIYNSLSYYFINFKYYKASYYKIIAFIEKTNYRIYSYPATNYYIPYLSSSINLDVVTNKTALDGGGYSQKSTYSWNVVNDIDYYIIQEYTYQKNNNNMLVLAPSLGNYRIDSSTQTSYNVNSAAFPYSSVIYHKVSSYYDISRSSSVKTPTIIEQ